MESASGYADAEADRFAFSSLLDRHKTAQPERLDEKLDLDILAVGEMHDRLSRAARWNFVGSWSTSDQWLFIGLKDGRNQSQASQHTLPYSWFVIDPKV